MKYLRGGLGLQGTNAGITLFDTAELYGPFTNEELAKERSVRSMRLLCTDAHRYLSCSITLRSLAPPKLFDYKERDFHRSNSPIDQTLDKR